MPCPPLTLPPPALIWQVNKSIKFNAGVLKCNDPPQAANWMIMCAHCQLSAFPIVLADVLMHHHYDWGIYSMPPNQRQCVLLDQNILPHRNVSITNSCHKATQIKPGWCALSPLSARPTGFLIKTTAWVINLLCCSVYTYNVCSAISASAFQEKTSESNLILHNSFIHWCRFVRQLCW